MPAVIQRETVVAAGITNDNVLSGSAFEYARFPSLVSIGCVASATGGFVTIQMGPTVLLEESPPAIRTTMPVQPDDFYYSGYAAPGDRLVIRCRNPTGGALTFRTIVQLTEAG